MGLIQNLLQEKEAYKVPEKLLNVMLDPDKKDKLLSLLANKMVDSGSDFLRDDFQEEQGDRKKLKQDYTPDCLTRLVSMLVPTAGSYADICAGTGALTIAVARNNLQAAYHCEEIASRAIPFLLCNLCLRNLSGEIREADALTDSVKNIYRLIPGERFSSIVVKSPEQQATLRVESVIMNPPYSLKWKPVHNEQYKDFEPLPSNAADFAFILHGLHLLKEGGSLIAIVPHGLLFRGNKEGQVRQKLIEKNLLDAVIGLPDKMFMNTSIPVCLLILKKNRPQRDVLFIDASKEYTKQGKQNVIEEKHIKKIASVFLERLEVKRFSHLAALEEIQENDFNCNIPRYVDTFIPPKIPPLSEIIAELEKNEEAIRQAEAEFYHMLLNLKGTTEDADKEIKDFTRRYKGYKDRKNKGDAAYEYAQRLFE